MGLVAVKISAQEAVFDDAAEGADAVFPADFFAFGVGSAMVGDGDFVDEETALCRTRGRDDFQKMSLNQSGKMAGIFWERNRR